MIYQGEELPGLHCKDIKKMAFDKIFFEKVFSTQRMSRYFHLFPDDEKKAIDLYIYNLKLSESLYVPLSVIEVTLRNSINQQLTLMTGREDWYTTFHNTPGLASLNHYITKAAKQIAARHELITPPKVVAELTLGFWVSLFNTEYEKVLWKSLRKAFPHMPKNIRKRKNVAAPLNRFRYLRNRVFHNESICWNISRIKLLNEEINDVLRWINPEIAQWLNDINRVPHQLEQYEVFGDNSGL